MMLHPPPPSIGRYEKLYSITRRKWNLAIRKFTPGHPLTSGVCSERGICQSCTFLVADDASHDLVYSRLIPPLGTPCCTRLGFPITHVAHKLLNLNNSRVICSVVAVDAGTDEDHGNRDVGDLFALAENRQNIWRWAGRMCTYMMIKQLRSKKEAVTVVRHISLGFLAMESGL